MKVLVGEARCVVRVLVAVGVNVHGGRQSRSGVSCWRGGWSVCGSESLGRGGRLRRRIVNGCKLHHDEPQTIAGDGRQDDGCQDQTGAVAPGDIREHAEYDNISQKDGQAIRIAMTND